MYRPPAPRALLLAVAVASGTSATAAPNATAAAPALDGTAWVLAELPGHGPAQERPATLRFEKGRVQGFDGCNRFKAAYQAQGTTLEIALSGEASMMTCPAERVHRAQAFAAALSVARSFLIEDDGRLVLLDFDGKTLATLAQAVILAGTSWRATAVKDAKQALASLVKDSTVTLEFRAGGQAAGSAGCNRYTARYASEGGSLEFGPPAATRMSCPQPELMQQEQSFLEALASVASAHARGSRLELRTAAGAPVVVLEPTAPAPQR